MTPLEMINELEIAKEIHKDWEVKAIAKVSGQYDGDTHGNAEWHGYWVRVYDEVIKYIKNSKELTKSADVDDCYKY